MVGCIMGGGGDKEKVLSAGPNSPALISERKFLVKDLTILRIICHLSDSVYNSKCLGALIVDMLVLSFNLSSVSSTRVILDSVNFLIHTMGIVVFIPQDTCED